MIPPVNGVGRLWQTRGFNNVVSTEVPSAVMTGSILRRFRRSAICRLLAGFQDPNAARLSPSCALGTMPATDAQSRTAERLLTRRALESVETGDCRISLRRCRNPPLPAGRRTPNYRWTHQSESALSSFRYAATSITAVDRGLAEKFSGRFQWRRADRPIAVSLISVGLVWIRTPDFAQQLVVNRFSVRNCRNLPSAVNHKSSSDNRSCISKTRIESRSSVTTS